ncbi:MAG: DUF4416 family protein [Spirochaetes bacterium]|nr:DUF4416 family protein [Spirochaetota bacterium]
MADPTIPVKAKLFIGILTASEDYLYSAETQLTKKFGPVDFKTGNIPFLHTEYYNYMDKNLFKVLISFKKLIPREKIVPIKLYTNKLEKKIHKEKRKINIDPGYITLSNIYLASCKEYFHRVYLDKGIYLENELKYVEKRYQPWDWTYPDYTKTEYLDFFYNIRKIYYSQINKKQH